MRFALMDLEQSSYQYLELLMCSAETEQAPITLWWNSLPVTYAAQYNATVRL
jgi:hypothetical protein